jgi:hypothetical protein
MNQPESFDFNDLMQELHSMPGISVEVIEENNLRVHNALKDYYVDLDSEMIAFVQVLPHPTGQGDCLMVEMETGDFVIIGADDYWFNVPEEDEAEDDYDLLSQTSNGHKQDLQSQASADEGYDEDEEVLTPSVREYEGYINDFLKNIANEDNLEEKADLFEMYYFFAQRAIACGINFEKWLDKLEAGLEKAPQLEALLKKQREEY